MNTVIQYIESYFPGCSVMFGNKCYRVQNDKNWLHIVVVENGKRRKIDLRNFLFDYGTKADYIFNEWYQIYPDYEQFKTFAENEISSLNKLAVLDGRFNEAL